MNYEQILYLYNNGANFDTAKYYIARTNHLYISGTVFYHLLSREQFFTIIETNRPSRVRIVLSRPNMARTKSQMQLYRARQKFLTVGSDARSFRVSAFPRFHVSAFLRFF